MKKDTKATTVFLARKLEAISMDCQTGRKSVRMALTAFAVHVAKVQKAEVLKHLRKHKHTVAHNSACAAPLCMDRDAVRTLLLYPAEAEDPAPVKRAARGRVTVHILHAGLPLCNFTRDAPREWPKGHKHVTLFEHRNARQPTNCERCLSLVPVLRPSNK